MFMVFQGLGVLLQVEICVAQLTVDGTESLQVLRPHLHCCFEEGCPSFEVPSLAQALSFQGQFQTGRLHSAKSKTVISRGVRLQRSHAALQWLKSLLHCTPRCARKKSTKRHQPWKKPRSRQQRPLCTQPQAPRPWSDTLWVIITWDHAASRPQRCGHWLSADTVGTWPPPETSLSGTSHRSARIYRLHLQVAKGSPPVPGRNLDKQLWASGSQGAHSHHKGNRASVFLPGEAQHRSHVPRLLMLAAFSSG